MTEAASESGLDGRIVTAGDEDWTALVERCA
jgi:hypothetical protein